MASACFFNTPQTIAILVPLLLLLLAFPVTPVYSSHIPATNQTFHPQQEFNKLKMIRAHLDKVNKPAVHTIQVTNSLIHYSVSLPPLFTKKTGRFCFGNAES